MRERKTLDFQGMHIRKSYVQPFFLHLRCLVNSLLRSEKPDMPKFWKLAAVAAHASNTGKTPKKWAAYWWAVCHEINDKQSLRDWWRFLS